MSHQTIPQRELRNNVSAILRAAEAGDTFTVTVRGRPVAFVGPVMNDGGPRRDVDRATILRLLSTPIDPGFAADLAAAEAPLDVHGATT